MEQFPTALQNTWVRCLPDTRTRTPSLGKSTGIVLTCWMLTQRSSLNPRKCRSGTQGPRRNRNPIGSQSLIPSRSRSRNPIRSQSRSLIRSRNSMRSQNQSQSRKRVSRTSQRQRLLGCPRPIPLARLPKTHPQARLRGLPQVGQAKEVRIPRRQPRRRLFLRKRQFPRRHLRPLRLRPRCPLRRQR